MRQIIVLFLCFIIAFLLVEPSVADDKKCELSGANQTFPEGFFFGVSTAAYQIEGGWNEDEKGLSIWDTFTHNFPHLIDDRSNGDIGPDSYHKFDEDLEALKELNVHYYRFSIAWTRIMPNGATVNKKGIDYYNMVINKLLAAGIQPMVTMLHYDLPEELSKLGGYTSPLFIDYFEAYADTLFRHFGDRVKMWITFNEPLLFCNFGYGNGIYPPRVYSPGVYDYLCIDGVLKAHTVVYHRYKRLYYNKQQGKVGITLNTAFHMSKINDQNIVDRALLYSLGWFANPLFTESGDYPWIILNDMAESNLYEGRGWPRMKPLGYEWSNLVRYASDFLGINYYASTYVAKAEPPYGPVPSMERDAAIAYEVDENWRRAKSDWLFCVPEGLEGLLKWIRDHYNNVEVIITENGWSDEGEINDQGRIDYLKAHLQAILNAVNDGCNVSGYVHWSLLDNFEWLRGYTEKFGLYRVDMNDPNKKRVAKDSARYYRDVIKERMIL